MPSTVINGQTYYYPEGSPAPTMDEGSIRGTYSTNPNAYGSTQTPGTTTAPTPTQTPGAVTPTPMPTLAPPYYIDPATGKPKEEYSSAIDPATGQVRKELLGGQYTDPNNIPENVLKERMDYRKRGYLGEFGTGAAGQWQTKGYDKSVDAYGKPTVLNYTKDEYLNPSLKPGTEFKPTAIQEQAGEIIDPNTGQLDPNAQQASLTQGTANQVDQVATATSATAGYTGAVDPTKTDAASYEAALATITPEATVQGQMSALMDQFADGQIPPWAAGAMRQAQQAMAGRGVGASSIAAESIVQAAMEAALPIAQADATVRAQAIFSNQSATNAARQFNAASQQQNDQFFANLKTTVDTFNASQKNAVEQFNAAQKQQVSIFNATSTNDISKFNVDQKNAMEKFNAEQANAISQFNATLRDSRDKFNSQNRLVIDQSNAVWRRTINTQNTAAENVANQFNASNLLNISNTAMNDLWQNFRDQADYAFTTSENDKTRKQNIALATLQQQQWFDRFDATAQHDLTIGLGGLVSTVFSGVVDDIDFSKIF